MNLKTARGDGDERPWPLGNRGLDLLDGQSRADTSGGRMPAAWEETLRLWLSWSDAYDQVSARMLKAGENLTELEALLDQADQLRQTAVERSRALLRQHPPIRRLA